MCGEQCATERHSHALSGFSWMATATQTAAATWTSKLLLEWQARMCVNKLNVSKRVCVCVCPRVF